MLIPPTYWKPGADSNVPASPRVATRGRGQQRRQLRLRSSNSIVSRPTTGTLTHQFLAEVRAGRPTVIGAHTTIPKPPLRARGGYASSVEASCDQHRRSHYG